MMSLPPLCHVLLTVGVKKALSRPGTEIDAQQFCTVFYQNGGLLCASNNMDARTHARTHAQHANGDSHRHMTCPQPLRTDMHAVNSTQCKVRASETQHLLTHSLTHSLVMNASTVEALGR